MMLFAPEAIIKACGTPRERDASASVVMPGLRELDTPEAIERARLWLINEAPEAVENVSGDMTTFQVACRVKDMGISEQTCLELMLDHWNDTDAYPPWSPDELEQKVANAYRYGKDPIGVAAPEAQFDKVEVEPSEPENASVHRFPLVPYKRLRPSSEVNYLVKGFLPREGVGVLWGPPKCGKSFSWYEIAMHVAMGREYRGRRVTQGTVVYCAFEGAAGYGARTEAFRRHHKIADDAEVPLYLMPARTNLIKDHPQLIAAIRSQLKEGVSSLAMVALDTLNRSFVGSESKDEDMTAYYLAADAIREAFGCFVQIIHHCGLDGTRPRGHSSLTGAVSVQHSQKRKGDDLTIEVEFMRDGPEGAKVESRLVTLEIGKDVEGDPITSCVTVPRTGFEDMKAPLTPQQEEWKAKLYDWAEKQSADICLPADKIPITVEVVREVIFARKDSEKDVRLSEPGDSRQNIRERMTEMTEKDVFRKLQRGQWVIVERRKDVTKT